MGVDLQHGKKDHYTRYLIYSPDTNIKNKVELDKNLVGYLFAKDITGYDAEGNIIGKFQQDEVRATIHTTDRVEIEPDSLLFAIAEERWYRVEKSSPNSVNETQRYSSRPSNETTINVVREL